MRVHNHPVLGEKKQTHDAVIIFDGKPIPCVAGEPVASALMAAGVFVLHSSAKNHEPRGLYCALGRCNECRMIVDGVPNVRTCVTPVRDKMVVETQHGHGKIELSGGSKPNAHIPGSGNTAQPRQNRVERMEIKKQTQVIVIGAGPAGLGAAIECAKCGAEVWVFDENDRPGGQLIKQLHKFFGSAEHMAGIRGFTIGEMLKEKAESLGVKVKLDSPVWGIFKGNRLGVYTPEGSVEEWQFEKLIIATGAIENPLAFPGWTLPGVMGAGACQTLVNIHRVLPGKRALVVGSGNVGLIIAYQLLQAGANEVTVIEAAPTIGGYGVHSSKIVRAGVPIYVSHTIKKAKGNGHVERVVIAEVDSDWKEISGTEKELEVDLVCLSVGLSPYLELARMAGCQMAFVNELGGYVPLHSEDMETTVPGIYVAGDTAGIEEASTALDEGRLAGVAASWSLGLTSKGEYSKQKTLISERLNALRSGSFGKKRFDGKALLLERWMCNE